MSDDESRAARPLAMSFLAAALFAVAVRLVWGNVVALTEAVRPGASLDLVSVTACQLLTVLAFVLLIARLYARDASLRGLLGLRSVGPITIVLAVLLGIFAEVPIGYLERFWAARFPMTTEQETELGKLLTADSGRAKAVLAVCVALVWPVSQELFFRGALFGRLRIGHDPRSVLYVVAAFYALSLGSPRGLMSATILGLAFTWIRSAAGSTWPAIIAHVAFMATAVARSFWGPPDEALVAKQAIASGAIGLVAIALLAWWLRRDARAEAGRAADQPAIVL